MDDGSTRRRLLELLLDGPSTAQALAGAVGVDTAAARRHLDAFLAGGLVQASFRREGPGRPRKYFAITDAGRETLPRRYADLLAFVARAAVKRDGPEGLARLMQATADEVAAEFADRVPRDAPVRERVRALAGVLRELDFPVEVVEKDGRIVVVRRDCAFLGLARRHPEAVCREFDTRLLQRLVGEDVQLTACLPWGDTACRHEVRLA